MYTYFCTVDRVIDGDTVVVTIDLGLHIKVTKTVRLLGINAPEMNIPEGPLAKEYLISILPKITVIQTVLDRDDKYGRLLGTLYDQTILGRNVNKAMLDAGHAKVM